MIKRIELSSTRSCLNKADADEPIFVLRAKDPMARIKLRMSYLMPGTSIVNS